MANAPSSRVAKGDKVLFASYAGTEIKVGTEEYMLMDEADILAIPVDLSGRQQGIGTRIARRDGTEV